MNLAWAQKRPRPVPRTVGIAFWFKQTGNWITHADGSSKWHGKTSAFYAANFDLLDGERVQQLPTSRANNVLVHA